MKRVKRKYKLEQYKTIKLRAHLANLYHTLLLLLAHYNLHTAAVKKSELCRNKKECRAGHSSCLESLYLLSLYDEPSAASGRGVGELRLDTASLPLHS